MEEKSKLILQNDTIIYDEGQLGRWEMSVADLEIVGEYTDPNGPYIDDYFFVFVVSPNHDHFHASFL
jgi:hypothetical protein